jgi:tetratricopeptide (TPR) repeat protein
MQPPAPLQAVYASYKSLAKYFAQIGRLHKAEFFFRRCLRLSQDTQVQAGPTAAAFAGSAAPPHIAPVQTPLLFSLTGDSGAPCTAQWLAGELEANLALGVVYEELHKTSAAIECYERRLALAQEAALGLERDTAYQNLTTVYLRQAEVQEAGGQADDAVASYSKCLSAADRAGDLPAAARANYRIGARRAQRASTAGACRVHARGARHGLLHVPHAHL